MVWVLRDTGCIKVETGLEVAAPALLTFWNWKVFEIQIKDHERKGDLATWGARKSYKERGRKKRRKETKKIPSVSCTSKHGPIQASRSFQIWVARKVPYLMLNGRKIKQKGIMVILKRSGVSWNISNIGLILSRMKNVATLILELSPTFARVGRYRRNKGFSITLIPNPKFHLHPIYTLSSLTSLILS